MQTLAGGLDAKRRRLAISLTPLIDIVFILVIFFMLVSTFQQRRVIETATPALGGGQAAVKVVSRLEVLAAGRLRLDDAMLSVHELPAALAAFKRTTPDQAIRIIAGEGATVQDLVRVIDAANKAGLANVSIDPKREAG